MLLEDHCYPTNGVEIPNVMKTGSHFTLSNFLRRTNKIDFSHNYYNEGSVVTVSCQIISYGNSKILYLGYICKDNVLILKVM